MTLSVLLPMNLDTEPSGPSLAPHLSMCRHVSHPADGVSCSTAYVPPRHLMFVCLCAATLPIMLMAYHVHVSMYHHVFHHVGDVPCSWRLFIAMEHWLRYWVCSIELSRRLTNFNKSKYIKRFLALYISSVVPQFYSFSRYLLFKKTGTRNYNKNYRWSI